MKAINTTIILSAILFVTAVCTGDELTQNREPQEQKEETADGLTVFTTNGNTEQTPQTRTSLKYDTGAFFWEEGDKIYVLDDGNTFQPSNNAVKGNTQSVFRFKVPGVYTGKSSYKVFYPGISGNADQVTIAAAQTQTEPNTTRHFGAAGDCGIGTANKNGLSFDFELVAQSSLSRVPALHRQCHTEKLLPYQDRSNLER